MRGRGTSAVRIAFWLFAVFVGMNVTGAVY